MGAGELKLGLFVVVELPETPAVGVVAHFTFLTEVLFVLILVLMAGEALFFRVFKGVADMAFFTRSKGMLAYERECGNVMVKKHLFRPALLVMTFFTLFFLLPLMDIVFFVTVKTLVAWFLFFHRLLMTLMTFHLGVFVF